MPEPIKIDPADFVPDSSGAASADSGKPFKIDPADFVPAKLLGGQHAELSNADSLGPKIAHAVENWVIPAITYPTAAGVGALAGTAIPGADLTGVSEIGGAMAGVAAASAANDILDAGINHVLFGTPAHINAPGTVPGFQHPGGALQQGMAMGAGAELAGRKIIPGALSAIFGVGSAKQAAREAADKAAQDVAQTAGEAADKQTAANLAEHEKAAALVAKEIEKNKRVAAKAAEAQGQANLDERVRAHGNATSAIEQFNQKARTRAAEGVTQASNAAQLETAVAEADRQRNALLGRAPEQTLAMQAQPTEAAITRRERLQNSVFEPIRRIADQMGNHYEEFFAPYRDNPIDAEPVAGVANEELEYAKTHGAFGPKITSTLREAQNLGADTRSPEEIAALVPEIMRGSKLVTPDAKYRYSQLIADEIDRTGTDRITGDRNRELAVQALGYKAAEPTNVQNLLKIRRAASQAMASERDAPSRAAAWNLVQRIDDQLEKSGIPKAAKLNREYKFFRNSFTPELSRQVSTSIEPTTWAGKLFTDASAPQRFNQLTRHSTPAEMDSYRDLFADYANGKGWSLKQIGENTNPQILKDLYGDSVLANKDTWLKLEPKELELKTLLGSSPVAREQYSRGLMSHLAEIQHAQADQLRTEGITLARQLGPAAKPLEAELFKAKTPQEIDAAAQKLANMTPEQVVTALAQQQRTPGRAAFETSLNKATKARDAFQMMRHNQVLPEQAAQQAVAKMPTSREAARDAIIHLQPGKTEQFIQRQAKYRAVTVGAFLLGSALESGHTSPYFIGLGAIEGALELYRGSHWLGRAILRNPQVADAVIDAVMAPKGVIGLRSAGRASADLVAALATQRAKETSGLQQQLGGVPADQAPARAQQDGTARLNQK